MNMKHMIRKTDVLFTSAHCNLIAELVALQSLFEAVAQEVNGSSMSLKSKTQGEHVDASG